MVLERGIEQIAKGGLQPDREVEVLLYVGEAIFGLSPEQIQSVAVLAKSMLETTVSDVVPSGDEVRTLAERAGFSFGQGVLLGVIYSMYMRANW